jgi:hypothetical protein
MEEEKHVCQGMDLHYKSALDDVKPEGLNPFFLKHRVAMGVCCHTPWEALMTLLSYRGVYLVS